MQHFLKLLWSLQVQLSAYIIAYVVIRTFSSFFLLFPNALISWKPLHVSTPNVIKIHIYMTRIFVVGWAPVS